MMRRLSDLVPACAAKMEINQCAALLLLEGETTDAREAVTLAKRRHYAMRSIIGADLSLDADPLFAGAVTLMERVSFAAWAEGT